MRNGLYRVRFRTRIGEGAGVVYARDGQFWGGDSLIYYVGTYATAGDKLTAKVVTDSHTSSNTDKTVFGVPHANITLSGTVRGDVVTATGTAAEAPDVTFQAELTRISD